MENIRPYILRLIAALKVRAWRVAQLFLINKHRQQLAFILSQHGSARQVIVFPPGLDWQKQLFQRPQHLALSLARQGILVFYVEPEESDSPSGFREEAKNLYLCHVPLTVFGHLFGLWVHTFTWNKKYTGFFLEPRLIYDFVDDLDVFQGSRTQLEKNHAELLLNATLVLATSEKLHELVINQRSDALLCPNGVDYDHFLPKKYPVPVDLMKILDMGKPIAGYYGALAKWFDYALLRQVAEKKPDWCFVLIGPESNGSLTASGLLGVSNIFWLNRKPYSELPAYLASFDVAIIPFIVNEITHATSPIKLFEYMAGGKPILITPMRESLRYDGVLVAGTSDEFSVKLEEALNLQNDLSYQMLIERTARENTWDARAAQILVAMNRFPLS